MVGALRQTCGAIVGATVSGNGSGPTLPCARNEIDRRDIEAAQVRTKLFNQVTEARQIWG